MTISERLFDIMDQKKVTAYSLCQKLGIGTSTVNNWKNRNTDPPAKYIVPICEYLNCSIEYLLTGQETEKAPVPEISRNGLEMLEIYELLPEREQVMEIGRLQAIIEPMIGDLHRLRYYNAEIMDDIKRREKEGWPDSEAGGQSSSVKAV